MEPVPCGCKDCLRISITSGQAKSSGPVQYETTALDSDFHREFEKVRGCLASLPFHTTPLVCEEFHANLREYGTRLHEAVFGQIYELWYEIVSRGRERYILDVEPSLWKFPWELLYHQKLGYLDSLSTPVVRWLGKEPYFLEVACLDRPSIYFAGADPIDHPTRADEQFEKLCAQTPNDINSAQVLSRSGRDPRNETPQWERIVNDLRRSTPDILHVVAHGKGANGLAFEGKSRYEEIIVSYETLNELLIDIQKVKLLILASCGSSIFFEEKPHLARKLFDQTELKAVVLMASDVSAETLIKFTELFYKALWNRVDVAYATAYARSMIRSQASKPISLQWSVPMLYETLSINPFSKWLGEVRKSVSAPSLPFEYLEAAKTEAGNIRKEMAKLARLRQQTHPASSSATFIMAKLKQACDRYRQTMSMFDQCYTPEDEFLLDSIRVTSSQTLPIIDRFTRSATGWEDSDKAITASENLAEELDEAVNLVLIRVSRGFRSWIES